VRVLALMVVLGMMGEMRATGSPTLGVVVLAVILLFALMSKQTR
jgi:hypothetical protein